MLVLVFALQWIVWWQSQRPSAIAAASDADRADRLCIAVGVPTLIWGITLRTVWPSVELLFAEHAARNAVVERWGYAYLVHSTLVFWVLPSLLGIAIVRRLAASIPPRGRVARVLLVLTSSVAVAVSATEDDYLASPWHGPQPVAFAGVACVAFVMRIVERSAVEANLLGIAQSLVFAALAIANRVHGAGGYSNRWRDSGAHPLALLGDAHGVRLHQLVRVVDALSVVAVVFGLTTVAAALVRRGHMRSLGVRWFSVLSVGLAGQAVILHGPVDGMRRPANVPEMPLPKVRSEETGPELLDPVDQADVVLDRIPPYRVVYRDERRLDWIRRGPVSRAEFRAELMSPLRTAGEDWGFDFDPSTDEYFLRRLRVAAPATMPLTRLANLQRDLGVEGVPQPLEYTLIVAIDVHREQPGFEMSPSHVRRYGSFDLVDAPNTFQRRRCARARLDANGALRVSAAPPVGTFLCRVELRIDPTTTISRFVSGLAPYTSHIGYRIDDGPQDHRWYCQGSPTADASADLLAESRCLNP